MPAPALPVAPITVWSEGELVRDPSVVSAITLNAEENKIRQVITNLMQNALRFSQEGSPIELVLSRDARQGRGILSVVDHGEGIPPQVRDKIFQRLWRADTSRARETGGSGLGLAIVETIIKRHQGSIRGGRHSRWRSHFCRLPAACPRRHQLTSFPLVCPPQGSVVCGSLRLRACPPTRKKSTHDQIPRR